MNFTLRLSAAVRERLRPGLAARLVVGFGTTLLLLMLVTGVAVYRMSQLSEQMDTIVNVNSRQAEAAKSMFDSLNDNYTAMLSAVIASDQEDIKYQLEIFDKTRASYASANKTAESLLKTGVVNPGMVQQFQRVAAIDVDTRFLTDQARDMIQDPAQKAMTAVVVSSQIKDSYVSWQKEIKALQEMANAASVQAMASAEASIAAAHTLLLGVTAVALVIGLGAAVWISRSVTRPVREALAVAQRVSGGDLSQSVALQGRDEGGMLLTGLAHMQQSLRALVSSVRDATDSITGASAEIASGNQDLSDRTEQTAGRLQQMSSAMGALTGVLTQSADAAVLANTRASNAAQAAQRGGDATAQVITTMEGISAGAREIGTIVGVIDGIAFQTNILALNAAVEAARAGEQGRGFAVVASEVRTLAMRSAEAAQQIKKLVSSSAERVEAGVRQVQSAGATMTDILQEVKGVRELISQLANAALDQRKSIVSVTETMHGLETMTQQNAALVEELAASAQAMRDQASLLSGTVAAFRTGENGAVLDHESRLLELAHVQ